MYIKISAILGILTGLYLIFFRHRVSRSIFRSQIGELNKGKNAQDFKSLKQKGLKGFLFNFLEFQVIFIGMILVLMYIPTFFPSSRKVIYTIVEFFVFSYFSVAFAGLIIGTLLRRLLFGEIEKYMLKKQDFQVFASNGSISRFPEMGESDTKNSEDAILKAKQKRCTIKAAICFIILYGIFLSSFFILVNTVK